MTNLELAKRKRNLERTRDRLKRLYRKKQPNPGDMPGQKLSDEYHMLWSLVGTIYLTEAMFKRFKALEQEYTVRVAGRSQF